VNASTRDSQTPLKPSTSASGSAKPHTPRPAAPNPDPSIDTWFEKGLQELQRLSTDEAYRKSKIHLMS